MSEVLENLKQKLEQASLGEKSSICLELSKIYRKLKQYEEALKHAELVKEYAQDEITYYDGVWMLGLINKNMGNKEETLKCYDICIDYYKANNKQLCLADMLRNKSRLIESISLALEALDTYIKADNSTTEDIDIGWDSYCDVLIAVGDCKGALKALNNIQNSELKNKVETRVQQALLNIK